ITPHKNQPNTSGQHRLAMLQLALASLPREGQQAIPKGLGVDIESFELDHDRPSYTLHTLQHLRAQWGSKTPLVWLIGMDSLTTLNRWHGWRRLLQYAHIAVLRRPGYQLPAVGEVAQWWLEHRAACEQLSAHPAGHCVMLESEEIAISSTEIRQLCAASGEGGLAASIIEQQLATLVTPAVARYIADKHLYSTK
ncbi:MAG TPA: nicotinate-nicotinamide nucleotide adenylyltransferase, partial [Marinagarivorans sp.]